MFVCNCTYLYAGVIQKVYEGLSRDLFHILVYRLHFLIVIKSCNLIEYFLNILDKNLLPFTKIYLFAELIKLVLHHQYHISDNNYCHSYRNLKDLQVYLFIFELGIMIVTFYITI